MLSKEIGLQFSMSSGSPFLYSNDRTPCFWVWESWPLKYPSFIDFLPRKSYVYSMLYQLKHERFFLNRYTHIFPQKNARGWKDWYKYCDRYSNLTALYITMSSDAFIISINSDNKISFQNVLCHWNLVHKKYLYAACENGRWKIWLTLTKLFESIIKGST